MNRYDILGWFFPNHCLICGKYVRAESFVCDSCLPEKANERVFNLKGKKQYFLYAFTPGDYKDNYRKAIDRFKFNGKTSYARKLAGFTFKVLDKEKFKDYSGVAYVPMSKKAVRKRGYNQARLYAQQVSKILSLPLVNSLEKVKDIRVQHSLSAQERKINIKGAYMSVGDIKGQKIILIDDIITTGATVCECAKMLYQNGAAHVTVICGASTPLTPVEPGDVLIEDKKGRAL